MGIDFYTLWDGKTQEDKDNDVGYIRESYHGKPYATQIFAPEAFKEDYDPDEGVPISADTLARRCGPAMVAALIRDAKRYGNKEARNLLMEMGIEPEHCTNPNPEMFVTEAGVDDVEGAVKEMEQHIINMLRDSQEMSTAEELPTPRDDVDVNQFMEDIVRYGGNPARFAAIVVMAFSQERNEGKPLRFYASF